MMMTEVPGPSYQVASGTTAKRSTPDPDNFSSNIDPANSLSELQLHALRLIESLDELRQRNELCDVILSVDGQDIPAHRVVLAAVSPYFNAMFTHKVKESREYIVKLKDMEANAIEEIVKFAYKGHVQVTQENVQAILNAASLLQLHKVQDICCDFLKKELDPSNCLGIRNFAGTRGCFDLKNTADMFTQQRFEEVCQHEEFLQLPKEQLINLIERDHLNVKQEECVFLAVINWVRYDPETRADQLASVLEYVRLPLVSWEFLTKKVVAEELVSGREDTRKYLNEARQYHARHYHVDLRLSQVLNLRTCPRLSFGQAEYIYVIGGETVGRETIRSVERYSPHRDMWSTVTRLSSPRRGAGAAVIDKLLYVVGGSDGLWALRQVEVFNPQTEEFVPAADMLEQRSSVCVLSYNSRLYACGGYDGSSSLRSCERYDPNYNEWTKIAEMSSRRSMAGIASLGVYIYIAGGYDGTSDLSTVEKYNTQLNEWSPVASMRSRRSMTGLAALNGKLYVVGGCNRSACLPDVEMYDQSLDVWTALAGMCVPRSGVGVAVLGQTLYALGGYDGNDYHSSVEVYDHVTDKWEVSSHMAVGRRRFGCCS
ncbi:kelch-like protein diablo [Branchiostoma floridae x Branchiostoma belcheri]